MNFSLFPFPPFLWLPIFVFLFATRIPCCLSNPDFYASCNTSQFVCGSIAAGFPFWGKDRPDVCGIPGLKLKCKNDTPTIEIKDETYRVLEIDEQSQTLRIAREDYMDGLCQPQLKNTTLDPQLFEYVPGYKNLTIIYGCPITVVPALFNCRISGSASPEGYVLPDAVGPGYCYRSVFVPVSELNLATAIISLSSLEGSLKQGFQVKWKVDDTTCTNCIGSKGVCGYDHLSKETTCYCLGQFIPTKTCTSSPDIVPDIPGIHLLAHFISYFPVFFIYFIETIIENQTLKLD
ncbi:hypothetical protein P3X46_016219 [Hevea brasiliensis]|uniref:non-specific serine/threonine protein kinase n=1 Tax=Hevea brasiliensis TaxID=3981 RepID=A0ABQ9LZS3_HEVBR|nr:hypothetical protein P3X46_016219 [Hevea brasiliensis]